MTCQACTRGFHKHHQSPCDCATCKPARKPMPLLATYALLGTIMQQQFAACSRFVPATEGACTCGEPEYAHSPGALMLDSFLSQFRKDEP